MAREVIEQEISTSDGKATTKVIKDPCIEDVTEYMVQCVIGEKVVGGVYESLPGGSVLTQNIKSILIIQE